MAGIGFELKKLFSRKGVYQKTKAYAFSTIITTGPFILCTSMITALQLVLSFEDVDMMQRQLFFASVVYAFGFSQIVTSGFSMVVTRYVSDKLYSEDYEKILPSFYGSVSIVLIIGSFIALFFLYGKPIGFEIKAAGYLLFMQLCILWIQTVYLSALKDYGRIIKAFACGVVATMVLTILLIKFIKGYDVILMLISMDSGMFVMITMLMNQMRAFFMKSYEGMFDFLSYLKKYKILFFINLLYTLSIYLQNFIFWRSPIGMKIYDAFYLSPIYDVATFYSYLTIMPAMVMFVVQFETKFYDNYRRYYSLVSSEGTLTQIRHAGQWMKKVLWDELMFMMQVQLFFTVIFMVLGYVVLPKLGLIQFSIEIYLILCLGQYFNIFIMILILTQLYFEDRRGALVSAALAFFMNLILNLITVHLDRSFYGDGFFLASMMTFLYSITRLRNHLRDLDYKTFCSQEF